MTYFVLTPIMLLYTSIYCIQKCNAQNGFEYETFVYKTFTLRYNGKIYIIITGHLLLKARANGMQNARGV